MVVRDELLEWVFSTVPRNRLQYRESYHDISFLCVFRWKNNFLMNRDSNKNNDKEIDETAI